MAVELKRRLLSAEEYHKMIEAGIFAEDDRLELLNGEIVYMSPVGNPHIGCVNWLNTILNQHLIGKAIVSIQNPIGLDMMSEPEPDVAICRLREDYYRTEKVKPADILLLIEVADSSVESDRKVKLPIYAKAGIPVYWIVNLIDRQVEIHSHPDREAGIYKIREIATVKDSAKLEALNLVLSVKEMVG